MRKIFITYSNKDDDFVERLCTNLESFDLHVKFDKRVLKPGDSLIKLFGEIEHSDVLIPIISQNSISSNWVQKELRGAIIKEIEESEFKVIPTIKEGENWDKLKEQMPNDLFQAMRDKNYSRFDINPYSEELKALVESIQPEVNPQEVYAEIQGPKGDNPFRRVRAEYFESTSLIARSFAEPGDVIYKKIVDIKPAIIEGGRGSGKTMTLKSLEAIVSVYRSAGKTFDEAGINFFGVYSRLSQGSFASGTSNILSHIDESVATRIFLSELLLRLIQSLIEELRICSDEGIIKINQQDENHITQKITNQIRSELKEKDMPRDFHGLNQLIRNELQLINEYISRKILNETSTYQSVFITRNTLREICHEISSTLFNSNHITIYFLLDEYENLLPFQKIVVNTILKWSESGFFSVKIATKKTGFKNPQTLENQEIEDPHDYSPVNLDYDISKPENRALYKNLLMRVCKNMLINEGFKEHDIRTILENRNLWDDFTESEILETISQMINKNLKELKEDERGEYIHRLGTAAVYRLALSNKKRKQFAGFNDFIFLSSGIIRYFLELCGMSYYFAIQEGINVKNGEKIKIKDQECAVYTLSAYHLYNIKKNIAGYGIKIETLIIDLGGIFRQKLLKHNSEPEGARISITDPQHLETPLLSEVNEILDSAVMHTVLQVRGGIGGMRPKHVTEVQPREYLINRIYSPILNFSPNYRWRTKFTCEMIKELVNPQTRGSMKSRLIRNIEKDVKEKPGIQIPLFEKNQEGIKDE